MIDKHTPTPWRTEFTERQPFFNTIYSVDDNAPEEIVCFITDSTDHARAQNDSNHIVKCVNMHDELVEALETATDYINSRGVVPHRTKSFSIKFKGLIKKARGES